MDTKVSVIIANRNDTTMLNVTVNSCIEALHQLSLNGIGGEIVIVDNSDDEVYALLPSILPTGYIDSGLIKLYRQSFQSLFTARETAIQKSSGKYIFCIDSHVIIGYNTLIDLYNFMESHKDDPTLGFAHAPVRWSHQHECKSRHDRDMTVSELGPWGKCYKKERTITWKGMPWMCRRDWFLDYEKGLAGYGCLSRHKISWGGGDMFIGLKPWLFGFKNWAVPTRPVIHIGPFPNTQESPSVDKYRLWSTSGKGPHAIGFLISCYALGGEPMMNRNKEAISERFGNFLNINKWWKIAMKIGRADKEYIETRRIMNFEKMLKLQPWNTKS